ncbi:hypothetical protein [Ruminococcus sp. NK3A76]|uniref:hypothetical protein n=1 Tax=Ruminococcus sp. NK3A76 TaxID=877411 RepID=UPI00048ACE8A|nr:hypothetical protein [Ruminococcus sp. NK3A76]
MLELIKGGATVYGVDGGVLMTVVFCVLFTVILVAALVINNIFKTKGRRRLRMFLISCLILAVPAVTTIATECYYRINKPSEYIRQVKKCTYEGNENGFYIFSYNRTKGFGPPLADEYVVIPESTELNDELKKDSIYNIYVKSFENGSDTDIQLTNVEKDMLILTDEHSAVIKNYSKQSKAVLCLALVVFIAFQIVIMMRNFDTTPAPPRNINDPMQ